MGNCCAKDDSISKPDQHLEVENKLGRKSRLGKGEIEEENIRFSEYRSTIIKYDEDLYSEFSSDYSDDELDTDWEHYGQDLTFERRGRAKPMFKEEILNKMIKKCKFKVQRLANKMGGFRIK